MPVKFILLPLILATQAFAAVTIQTSFTGTHWTYAYVVPAPTDGGTIDGVTLDLQGEVFDLDTLAGVKTTANSLKLDPDSPGAFAFSFSSLLAPALSEIRVKLGRDSYAEQVMAPGASIPEPSTACLAALGLLALRRRR